MDRIIEITVKCIECGQALDACIEGPMVGRHAVRDSAWATIKVKPCTCVKDAAEDEE